MSTPAPRTLLADLGRAERQAVVRRIVGVKAPVVAPLDVAAFNSAI